MDNGIFDAGDEINAGRFGQRPDVFKEPLDNIATLGLQAHEYKRLQ